jgi:hypothetical protein
MFVSFFVFVLVCLLDPVLLTGYCAAGFLCRRLSRALAIATGWAIAVTLVMTIPAARGSLDGYNLATLLAARVVGGGIVADVAFAIRRISGFLS